jgi:hypothetical protein
MRIVRPALLLLAAAALAVPAFSAKKEAIVYGVEGDVSVQRRDKIEPAKLDFVCKPGDVFRVGADSVFEITLHNFVGLRVYGPAEVRVVKTSDSDIRFKIPQGDVFVRMRPPSNLRTSLQIETAEAIVTAKIGQFVIRKAEAPGKGPVVSYGVAKGSIDVRIKSVGSTIPVQENQALDVAVGSRATPAVRGVLDDEKRILRETNGVPIEA